MALHSKTLSISKEKSKKKDESDSHCPQDML